MLQDRSRIAVTQEFKDFFKHWVTTPNIPIKSVGQLVTLATMEWYEEYKDADTEKRKKMVENLDVLRTQAEAKGFLQNSRELEVE